ncbi:S24/S26 family peptidase [Sphingobacterium chuzhouense]|uniref:S24/S26 family peptidase n=1 Tax=Sphingobacterium chuzhouense TaxID=1742264 RepID=A0ABR7XXD4_9SPHI|nr:S24/S26 family peptidase [Sphingobacterium chuzhouense]MBD1423720.1 S24/S26 family peptidase [Sphingobacterium chuzhouense]
MDKNDAEVTLIKNAEFFKMVEQHLDEGNQVWIPVVGKSMEPFLRERDTACLQTVGVADIAVGDIVLAKWRQRHVLHRVVRKETNELWLVGDNNLVQVEKIPAADLIAAVVEAHRAGKPLSVCNTLNKNLGIVWYYLRLPRRVVAAIKRRIWE